MSTAEFGDPNLGQAPAPAPAPDAPIAPLTLTPPAPLEPLASTVPAAPVETTVAPIALTDMREVPLGTLIFREGLLTEEQLEEALQDGMRRGKRLGEVLLERGLVSENDLGRLLAGQKGLRFVQLDAAAVDPAAVRLLPVEKARLHTVLPIGFQDGLPVVAVADPSNDLVVENVRRALNCEPHLIVAGREALSRQIELAYAPATQVAAPATSVAAESAPVAPVVPVEPAAPVVPAAPIAVEPEVAPMVPVEPVNGDGVWLGTPAPLVQPEPVVQPQPVFPVEPQPVLQSEPFVQPQPVVQPEPVVVSEPVQPVLETPVVAPVVPEPVSISYTPVEPLEQPVVMEPAPLPVQEPFVAAEPAVVVPEPTVVESVLVPEPLVAPDPVVTPEPALRTEPAFTPEPVTETYAAAGEPATEPEPETDAVLTWSVALRLADGDRIDIGTFRSSEEATQHARNVVEQISVQNGWPFFEGRFIRPEGIVSVDLLEPEARWLGSTARRQWAQPS